MKKYLLSILFSLFVLFQISYVSAYEILSDSGALITHSSPDSVVWSSNGNGGYEAYGYQIPLYLSGTMVANKWGITSLTSGVDSFGGKSYYHMY